jgi:hypothetical protein
MSTSALELPFAPILSNTAIALDGYISGDLVDRWTSDAVRQGQRACEELLTEDAKPWINTLAAPGLAETWLALRSRFKDAEVAREKLAQAREVLLAIQSGGEWSVDKAKSARDFLSELSDELISRSQWTRRLGYQ